jgi:N-acetyl-anhydromuramoyl-L-alanine amidase
VSRKIGPPPGTADSPLRDASLFGDSPNRGPMKLSRDGTLACATQVVSPNCDARPRGQAVTLVVVHGISLPPGEFGGDAVERLFTNSLDYAAHPFFEELRGLRVSAHFLIRRGGGIIQFVPCGKRAWHAGASCYAGRERCNDFSIGIELEGTGDTAYTDVQYEALAALIDALRARYPIADVVGHSDVAPGRKFDPGPSFDWERLRASLHRA